MAIELEGQRTQGAPVLKRSEIGEVFTGGIIKFEQRDDLKFNPETGENERQIKPNGKAKQEMVVTLRTIESTMGASIGDVSTTPAEGDTVRLILSKGAFGSWIDAVDAFRGKAGRGLNVGDVLSMNTTHAEVYSRTPPYKQQGEVKTAEEVAAFRDGGGADKSTLGWRGLLVINAPTVAQLAVVDECEREYMALRDAIAAQPEAQEDHALYNEGSTATSSSPGAKSDPFAGV